MLVQARVCKRLGERLVLDDFRIDIAIGEIVALIGESGSGKSTLARVIVGAVDPGASVVSMPAGTRIAYVPQQPEIADWRTAAENISLEQELFESSAALDEPRMVHALKIVDLADAADRLPTEFSVGMRQRLQLGRALFTQAELVLADEPLAGVDELRRDRIVHESRALLKEAGRAALWITHDIAEALQVADRVLVMTRNGACAAEIHVSEDARRGARRERSETERSLRQALQRDLGGRSSSVELATPEPKVRPRLPLAPITVLALVLAAWWLASSLRPELKFFLSSPLDVAETLVGELSGDRFLADIGWTVAEAAVGFGLALIGGSLIGSVGAVSDFARAGLKPYLIGATAVPLFVLAPAFIIWFGVGFWMKVALAALSAGPIIALGLLEPFDLRETEFARHALRQGVSRWRLFKLFVLPKGILAFLATWRPAAVAALIGAFLGEFISSDRGLGYYILLNASRYHLEEVLAGTCMLFALALVVQFFTSVLAAKRVFLVRLLRRPLS